MEAVIFIVGLGVAQLMSKLGKTQGQGIAIFMVVMGAVLFAIWSCQLEWVCWEWTLAP